MKRLEAKTNRNGKVWEEVHLSGRVKIEQYSVNGQEVRLYGVILCTGVRMFVDKSDIRIAEYVDVDLDELKKEVGL